MRDTAKKDVTQQNGITDGVSNANNGKERQIIEPFWMRRRLPVQWLAVPALGFAIAVIQRRRNRSLEELTVEEATRRAQEGADQLADLLARFNRRYAERYNKEHPEGIPIEPTTANQALRNSLASRLMSLLTKNYNIVPSENTTRELAHNES